MNLSSTLRESPSLQFFIKALQTEPSLLIEELWDAPKACLIELALATTNKNILVITGGAREERLLDDLAYFSKRPILDFPAWETLPGEEIAPSPDIVGKRLAILEKLLTEQKPHIVLAPLQSCLQKLPAPASIKNKLQAFHVGEEISFEHLPPLLSSLGYARAPVVSDKGEFAIRGGILDIFPVGAFEPYRIEFFGDKIESIRSFDPSSQKSVQKYQELLLTPASEYALLHEESTPALILDYLGKDTLLVFDDLLTLEDRYVSLKKLPGAASKYFLSFEDFLQESASLQKLFWTKEQIEELSDVALTKKVGRAFYAGKEPLQPLSFSIFEKEIADQTVQPPLSRDLRLLLLFRK